MTADACHLTLCPEHCTLCVRITAQSTPPLTKTRWLRLNNRETLTNTAQSTQQGFMSQPQWKIKIFTLICKNPLGYGLHWVAAQQNVEHHITTCPKAPIVQLMKKPHFTQSFISMASRGHHGQIHSHSVLFYSNSNGGLLVNLKHLVLVKYPKQNSGMCVIFQCRSFKKSTVHSASCVHCFYVRDKQTVVKVC